MGIPASLRLRANSEFQRVRSSGYRANYGPFIFNVRRDTASVEAARLGVVASRRVGNAVIRNRGKRLIRELFRKHRNTIPTGVELVVILRSTYGGYSFEKLEKRFLQGLAEISSKLDSASQAK